MEVCDSCNGTRKIICIVCGDDGDICDDCGSTGEIECDQCEGDV